MSKHEKAVFNTLAKELSPGPDGKGPGGAAAKLSPGMSELLAGQLEARAELLTPQLNGYAMQMQKMEKLLQM